MQDSENIMFLFTGIIFLLGWNYVIKTDILGHLLKPSNFHNLKQKKIMCFSYDKIFWKIKCVCPLITLKLYQLLWEWHWTLASVLLCQITRLCLPSDTFSKGQQSITWILLQWFQGCCLVQSRWFIQVRLTKGSCITPKSVKLCNYVKQ